MTSAAHLLAPRADDGGRERLAFAAVLLIVLLSAALLAATGNPAIAAAPTLALVGAVVLWKLPLRWTVIGYTGIALAVSLVPRVTPDAHDTRWESPVYPIYRFLSDNLDSTTGISALRFSGAELLYLVMLGLLGARVLLRDPIDRVDRPPTVNVLPVALWLAGVAVIAMEVWGVARGGDFRQSLWQLRALLWLPILAALFSYCLRGVRDLRAVAIVVSVAACVKILLGLYFMITYAWPMHWKPESMTGHEDSVMFSSVFFFWLAALVHRPSPRAALRFLVIGTIIMAGLVVNNRRIAFVELIGSAVAFYVLLEGPVKRAITRGFFYSLPFLAVYLMAGRHHNSGIFKPAALVMSVSQQKDGSSKTRDIENFNLIQTLKPQKLLGSGWGHEYNEVVKADDISKFFAQYRFVAHNSILWLLGIAGAVWFPFVWLPVVIGIFLATRSYYAASNATERTAAAATLAVLIAYIIQAWGDMGTQGMMSELVVAWALAAAGRLAYDTGAWPAGLRLFGHARVQRVRARGLA